MTKILVDANEVLEIMRNEGCDCEFFPYVINTASVVDAVEVVRCKNCANCEKNTVDKIDFLICHDTGRDVKAEDFCSYGKRRYPDA